MKILVIGNGGREHAIVDKIAQSPLVSKIYALPGNHGIASLAQCIDIDLLDNKKIVNFASEKAIDLVIIGPESALSNGLSDALTQAKIKAFGPSKKATMIESS